MTQQRLLFCDRCKEDLIFVNAGESTLLRPRRASHCSNYKQGLGVIKSTICQGIGTDEQDAKGAFPHPFGPSPDERTPDTAPRPLRSIWRVGHKVKLNVYEGDTPMFQCHTPEDAERIVGLLNQVTRHVDARLKPDTAPAPDTEREPMLDVGQRVVLINAPDIRGAVMHCDIYGHVRVALDDGATGHFCIIDLACEDCFDEAVRGSIGADALAGNAKQPDPPVSAQELREIAGSFTSPSKIITEQRRVRLDKLRKLADWLPAPPDLERRK